jgi:hypothetical protein
MARADTADTPPPLPDAPSAAAAQTSSQNDAPPATGQSSSQSWPAPSKAPPLTPEEQRKKAQQQLDQEEHQRVWAVVATFNTTANQEAVPLSKGQKFQLFFMSAFDPWPFCWQRFLPARTRLRIAFRSGARAYKGMPSDLVRPTGTTSSATSWVMLCWPARYAKIRATTRRARAVTPGVLFGRQPAPCGASEIAERGDRTTQSS